MAAPPVTVAVATYNRSATLRLALESLQLQDFGDFEVWVVGDACTDDSEAAVRSLGDSRFQWTNLGTNSGSQAAPNNEALRRARGRYVAYLGHDDLWLPGHLSGLLACIERTGSDLVHSLCAMLGPAGTRSGIGPPRLDSAYDRHFVPPSAWLHRRDLVDACGDWADPDRLPWPVDFDYTRRAFVAGKRITFHPRLTVLKFPSNWYPRAYASGDASLQARYLDAIRTGPEDVERQVLLEWAIESAMLEWGGDGPVRVAWARACRVTFRALRDRLGRDRWPLGVLNRWRFQRARRASRLRRGLPAGERGGPSRRSTGA